MIGVTQLGHKSPLEAWKTGGFAHIQPSPTFPFFATGHIFLRLNFGHRFHRFTQTFINFLT